MGAFMDLKSIGINIKKYRIEKGLSQEKLAEMTDLSPNYISMIERAVKTPSLTTLINIANALDVTTDMILYDVLNEHYQIKSSLVFDKVSKLSEEEQNRIYNIINVFL